MLDFAVNAARSVLGTLGVVEQRAEQLMPGAERLDEGIEALHRAASALDHHVEAIEALGESVPELAIAVTRLCEQLAAALALAAPVEAAEREVTGGLRRLLHPRRRRAPAPLPLPTPPPSAPDGGSGSAPR